jgi:serine/threonine protein kinase/tetratricopeptide (TPR) repeat protein
MSWAPGTEVRDYVVEGVLGGSGVAVVYAARHRVLGTHHAIKVLSVDTPALRGRLWREAALHTRLEHPNLVPVRDVLEVEGGSGVVMPLVRGPTLASLLASRTLQVDEGVALFRGIVAGVAHAHSRGVAHCDLKPGNVLLDIDSGGVVPRVGDFGLARLSGEVGPHEAFGTPGYMAPEQHEDPASADHRADLYALGCVLHELLTGQRAFADPLAVTRRTVAPLPARWAALVDALLQPDPDRRMSAQQLEEELAREMDTRSLGPSSALARDARRSTPALLTSRPLPPPDPDALPHNLEPERDTFVGRGPELLHLSEAVAPGRLVTLVGTGGVGKTRLVLQFGRQQLEQRSASGGVWFCSLESAHTERELVAELLAALGLPPGIGERLESALATFAGAVVILDNLEQLEPDAVARVDALVAGAPGVAFLATSREPLGLPGEQVLELAPLPLPSPEGVADSASVRLFVERASAAGASLDLGHEGVASAVCRIVELLDGLPLALEIAAARVALVSPGSLADHLSVQLDARRAGGGPERQRTLRAALDASWEMLEPWERTAWAQLSVFEGGFTLQDAEAVLAPGISRAIERLIRRSLLRVEDGRFSMLSTIAAYTRERLCDLGGGRAVEARHGAWFATYGRAAVEDPQSVSRSLRGDRANLVAAARRALRRGDDEVAVHATLAALAVLLERGPHDMAGELGLAALQVAAPGPARGALRVATGKVLGSGGTPDVALAMLQAAIEEAASAGWVGIELDAKVALSRLESLRDLDRAQQMLEEVRVRAVEAGDTLREARALVALAGILSDAGQPHLAEPLVRRGMAQLEGLGEPRSARLISLLASCRGQQGDLEGCLVLAHEALALTREHRDPGLEGVIHTNLGNVASRQGRLQEAGAHFRAAIQLQRRVGSEARVLVPLYNLGDNCARLGDLAGARGLHLEGLALARRLGDQLSECNALFALGLLDSREDLLQQACDSYRACIEVAQRCDPVLVGFARANLANVLRRQGRLELARQEAEIALTELQDHPLWQTHALTMLGKVLVDLDEREAAEVHLQRALATASGEDIRSNALTALSLLRYKAGQLEEARALAEQSVVGDCTLRHKAAALLWLGKIAAETGDVARAREALVAARELAGDVPRHSEIGKDLLALEALLAEL